MVSMLGSALASIGIASRSHKEDCTQSDHGAKLEFGSEITLSDVADEG